MRLALLIATAAMACGQDAKLQFEVASVRLAAPEGRGGFRGGPGTADPERLAITNATLRRLLLSALAAEDF